MQHICIVTQNLFYGGVQWIVSHLANHLNQKNYRVTIIVCEDKISAFSLSPNINVVSLVLEKVDLSSSMSQEEKITLGLKILSNRTRQLEVLLKSLSPELVMGFEDYHNIMLLQASREIICPIIITSCVSLSHYYSSQLIHLLDPSYYRDAIKLYYPLANNIVVLAPGIKDELKMLGIGSTVIGNGIPLLEIESAVIPKRNHNYILHAGRFDNRQKGQLDLLHAFALVCNQIPQDLFFIGEGPDRSEVEQMAHTLGISHRVFFYDFTSQLYDYMRRADYFVFPSYFEGFPSTILMAMATHTPCISYDFEPSWYEISNNGHAIKITPRKDIVALSNALLEFSNNKSLRRMYAKRAYRVVQHYDMDHILAKWLILIKTYI